ncbi:aminotransferase [Clostridia bacterium]|nr:aminotransferase [Clostridia bacterium]
MSEFTPRVNSRVASIKPSGIRRFFDLAETIKDCISLGVGEPDFLTPYHIRDAGIVTLERGLTRYSPNAGYSALRKAVSRYLERRFELSYDWNGEILVTVGGSEAIDLAVRAIAEPGDEVLIPEPSFVCYTPIALLAGAVPVPIRTAEADSFKLTPELLKAAITPRTRILMLPYPCNPTGGIMTRADLEALAAVIRDTDITIISDEIYAELTYGGKHVSIASLPGMRARTIYVGGLSKSHSMTGWRMGYACGDRAFLSQMTKIHQFAVMCAPTTSQYAAIEALENGDGDIERMRDDYDTRRRLFVEGARALGLPVFEPEGAFYAFPNIQGTGLSSQMFAEELIKSQRVAVIPGEAFGESGGGFVRACYAASSDNLKTALERIGRFLETL